MYFSYFSNLRFFDYLEFVTTLRPDSARIRSPSCDRSASTHVPTPPIEAFALLRQDISSDSSVRSLPSTLQDENQHSSDELRESAHHKPISLRWSEFTDKRRWCILAFWVIQWPLGMAYFPRFIHSTSSEFQPVPGTLSYEADRVYKEAYNIPLGDRLPVIVLLEQQKREDICLGNIDNDTNETNSCPTLIDGVSDLYTTTRDFVLNMSKHLEQVAANFDPKDTYREPFSSYFTSSLTNVSRILSLPLQQVDEHALVPPYAMKMQQTNSNATSYARIGSYYAAEKAGLHTLAKRAFASKDGHMTFLRIEFATPSEGTKNEFLREITAYGSSNVPKGVNVSYTGLHYFQLDMLHGIRADMEVMDFFSLPLALLVVALVLGNLPIMVIPLLTIISTIFFAGTLMYPITQLTQVTQFTPSLMMSLIISMSIDYSLFLLTRCTEDVAKRFGVQHKKLAIVQMLKFSGHTIITSGVTLCCCFLGLLLLPLPMLRR